MPEISIIMAAYNAAGSISESLQSVLAQTFADIEVIVVDDGSRDSTADIVRSIGDSRVRLIQQQNRGQSAALNTGAMAATGRFLKFLDSDDCLNPDHLVAQLGALTGYEQHVASCRWGYFVNDALHPAIRHEAVQRHFEEPLEWLVTSLTLDQGMMGGWLWLIPRAIWDRCGGWDERLSLNNDFDFSIRLLLASHGVRFAPDAVYSYRKSLSGTLSGSKGRKAMESAWLTTHQGTSALMAKENSDRVRQICADRFQSWMFQFYPKFPDLLEQTDTRIRELGGSRVRMQGGGLCRLLQPMVGWKGVRQLQELAVYAGWNWIRARKSRQRLATIENAPLEKATRETIGSAPN